MGTGYAVSGLPPGPHRPLPAQQGEVQAAFALHRKGKTALHYAAEHGHLPAVNALIHAGAPLDVQDYDRFVRWAFCAAGRRGAESVAGRRGPMPPSGAAVARRWTPLHYAAKYGHANAMAALLGAGAAASVENWQGCAASAATTAPSGRPPPPQPPVH